MHAFYLEPGSPSSLPSCLLPTQISAPMEAVWTAFPRRSLGQRNPRITGFAFVPAWGVIYNRPLCLSLYLVSLPCRAQAQRWGSCWGPQGAPGLGGSFSDPGPVNGGRHRAHTCHRCPCPRTQTHAHTPERRSRRCRLTPPPNPAVPTLPPRAGWSRHWINPVPGWLSSSGLLLGSLRCFPQGREKTKGFEGVGRRGAG